MDYDDYLENERIKNDLQEIPVYTRCDRCNAEIYYGNEYYNYEGDDLCEECFDDIQSDEKSEARRYAGDEEDEDYD